MSRPSVKSAMQEIDKEKYAAVKFLLFFPEPYRLAFKE